MICFSAMKASHKLSAGLKLCLAFAALLPAAAQAGSFDRPHSARAEKGGGKHNILDKFEFKEIRILDAPKFKKIRRAAEDCIKKRAPGLFLSEKIQSESGLSQAMEALAALCAFRITDGPPADSRDFSPHEALLAQAVWGTTDGASLRQASYWYLRYRLNFLWSIREPRPAANDWEMSAMP